MLCFHVLWGHSIGVMVFVLYKLYFISSYTNPTPKPTLRRKHNAYLDFQKTSFCMIYKIFPHGDLKNVPTRSKFTGTTIRVGTFGPHNVINTRYTHTHTHTHTHTLSHYNGLKPFLYTLYIYILYFIIFAADQNIFKLQLYNKYDLI